MPSDSGKFLLAWQTARDNFRAAPVSVSLLLAVLIFGCVEYVLWGRSHLEDGIPLLALLLLATYDQLRNPLQRKPSAAAGATGWALLCLSLAVGAWIWAGAGRQDGESQRLLPIVCKNAALLGVAVAVTLRQDGFPVALRFFPLHVHAIVILPLYEYILLEFSYPLRLVSTQVSVWLMRCLGLNVRCDGPSLLFDGQVLSITDACTGIGLLGMLFFLAYWIVRKIRSEAWKKWCWSLLVILWIILANALRLLMTFLLYQVCGQKVFERELHFLLGCFFIVAASLFTWSSAMIFQLDTTKETP